MPNIPSRTPPYCDQNLSGSRVELVPESHLVLDGVRLDLPGENVLYNRLRSDGTQFVGVGHQSGAVWIWDGHWREDGQCEGTNPVIYRADGGLEIVRKSTGSNPTGALGWRYVDDAGQLVSSMDSYDPDSRIAQEQHIEHLWEYTVRGDLAVGQGGDEEGLQALVRGRRVLIHAGYVRNIHMYRDGERVVIAAIFEALTPLFYDTTMTALDTLPTYTIPGTIPGPEPIPPEPPEPQPPEPAPQPPEPPEPMMSVFAYAPPSVGFVLGEKIDNHNGTVSIKKPNGQYLCVTPEGNVEERPTGGGPWESFKVGKTTLIAERDPAAVYVLPFVEA